MTEHRLRRVLAKRLRDLMDKRPDLETQEKVAKRSNVAQTTVGRILRGSVAATLDNVEAIAGAFGVPAASLLSEERTNPVLQYDVGKLEGLPEADKGRIAAFIAFTLEQHSRLNQGQLSFVESRIPSREQAEVAALAGRRPVGDVQGALSDAQEKGRKARQGKSRLSTDD